MTKTKWQGIEKEFEKKFHQRMENIARQLNPSGYLVADSMGSVDADGPQIYGEIKAFLRSTLKQFAKEVVDNAEDMVYNYTNELSKSKKTSLRKRWVQMRCLW